MRIDWWTLGLQAVNALVLIWILSRFLFRPVAAMIAARQAEARRILDEAKASQAEAEAEKRKAEAREAALATERGAALSAAAAEAEKQKASILAAAHAEAAKLRAEAKAEIERTRTRDTTAAEDRAARLAVDISAKLLARLPDTVRITSFIDGLAAGIADLPQATRSEIGADGEDGKDGKDVRLTAARALTEAEQDTVRTALESALGRKVSLAVDVDPALIAGLELTTDHAVVRNSLRADLDRLAGELAKNDRT